MVRIQELVIFYRCSRKRTDRKRMRSHPFSIEERHIETFRVSHLKETFRLTMRRIRWKKIAIVASFSFIVLVSWSMLIPRRKFFPTTFGMCGGRF